MPQHLLNDPEMIKTMKALGAELVANIERIGERTVDRNPQVVYGVFKRKLGAAARERAKSKVPKIQRRLDALREAFVRTVRALSPEKAELEIRNAE